ncbi:hypothetical protein E3O65_02635 [Cryobacterium breve]|uniref:Uncharacterized protein n=1 Tax=Cryobacterium breve TaxID=1259258 RepID=A0ABY2J6X4_9MICO|nr:hypothetical protein E3T20_04110 [Cryobacterium sp. TmT3-12]TFD00685.1 hypothetical protein E3O65_02635 [Cryobacterium breve]
MGADARLGPAEPEPRTSASAAARTSAVVVPRQSVVKSVGISRRARLTPAPDTDPNPHPPVLREEGGIVPAKPGGPGTHGVNDDRLRQDRPPHW